MLRTVKWASRFRSLLVPLAALLAAGTASGQTNGTWIGNASSTWSTTANWQGGTVPDGGGIATFNNLTGQTGGFTATIDTTRVLSEIRYDMGYSYTVAASGGATIAMPAAGGFTINSINSLRSSPSLFFTTANTISAPISGTGDLIKIGAGFSAITGANTFIGTVRANAGTLWMNGGDAGFGNLANGIDFNGGAIGINTTGGFTSNRAVNVGAAGGTFRTFTALTLGATSTLTGTGTLVKQIGNNGLVIQGNGSGFTGNLQLEAGTVTLQTSGGSNGRIGGTGVVDLASTLTIDNSLGNFDNRAGGRDLVARGGTLILNGSGTAAVTEALGTLTLAQGNQFVTVSPNAAQTATVSFTGLTRQNNATLFVRATALGTAPGANIGNVVFSGSPGTLIGGGGDPTASVIASILPFATGNISATATAGSSFVTWESVSGRLVPLNLSTGYATDILTAGTQDNVNQNVSATLAAATTVNSLRLAPTAAVAVDGAALTVTSGAILYTAATAFVTNISAPLTAGTQELVVTSTNGSAFVTIPTGLTLSGVVSGTGGLTKTGAGVLFVTGANTYTGPTTLAGGTLLLGSGTLTGDGSAPSALGQDTSAIVQTSTGGTNRLYTNGNLVINRNLTVITGGAAVAAVGTTSLTASESVVINGNVALANPTGSTTNGFYALEGGDTRPEAVTINGNISGAGGLRSNFGAYQILAGNNSYSGGTLLGGSGNQIGTGVAAQTVGETWEAGSDTAFGTGTIFIASSTGTPQPIPGLAVLVSAGTGPRTLANPIVLVTGFARIDGTNPLTLSGPVELNGSAANTSYLNVASAAAPVTISGVISRGGFVKDGPGTLTLSGTNDYTGQTMIRRGVLSVAGIGNGGTAGNLGGAPSAGSYITISGNALGDTGALRYTGAGESTNRLIAVAGSGATLDASGAGPLAFTSTSSFVMNTPLGIGSITGASFVINAGVISLSTQFAAQFVVGSAVTGNANIPANTVISEVGTNYIRLSNATTNATALTAQAFTVTFPGAVPFRTLTLTGTNTGLNSIAPIIPNNASIPTAVAKTGSGTWLLTGNNTYTAGTTVTAGSLLVNGQSGTNSGTGTGAVTVAAAGTLGGAGRVAGASLIDGTVAPGLNAPGMLTVGGAVNLNGTYLARVVGTNGARLQGDAGVAVTLGAASLLTFDVGNSYDPATTFVLIDAPGGLTGTFSNFTQGTGIPGGSHFVSYTATQVQLAPVPEPGLILLAAGAGLVWVRRRRATA